MNPILGPFSNYFDGENTFFIVVQINTITIIRIGNKNVINLKINLNLFSFDIALKYNPDMFYTHFVRFTHITKPMTETKWSV